MKNIAAISISLLLLAVTSVAQADSIEKLQNRSEKAATILRKIVAIPDDTIPESLLRKSTCIVTFPNVLRVGFVFGARHGKGLASCRVPGGWSSPSFMTVNGGSWGLQIGISSTDLVLAFVRPDAVDRLQGSDFTLGADASLSAGPLGRHLEVGTDFELKSEIYAYSQSKGLFAGLTIEGAAMFVDTESNSEVYGANVTARELLTTAMRPSVTGEAYPQALMETAP